MSEWNVENCRGGLFLGASRCRACASRTARDVSVSALWAVIEGVNELAMLRNAAEYSPPRRGRGGRDGLIEAGATGAKREPDRAKPQLMVSSAKLFRPKHLAELTTITASRSRFAPVCGFFGGFATFIDAAVFPSSARRGIPEFNF